MLLNELRCLQQSAQNTWRGIVLGAGLQTAVRRVARNHASRRAIFARILPASYSRLAVFGRRSMPHDPRKPAGFRGSCRFVSPCKMLKTCSSPSRGIILCELQHAYQEDRGTGQQDQPHGWVSAADSRLVSDDAVVVDRNRASTHDHAEQGHSDCQPSPHLHRFIYIVCSSVCMTAVVDRARWKTGACAVSGPFEHR